MMPFYENRPNDIFAFNSNKPDFAPHLHIHLELIYILEGELKVTVDGVSKVINAVIFPNCVHQHTINTQGNPFKMAVLAVKPKLAGDFSNIILSTLPEVPFLNAESVSDQLINSFDQVSEFSTKSEENEYIPIMIRSYIQIILGIILKELKLVKNNHTEYHLIEKSINYILENYMKELSLETVANQVGVTRCHLSAAFSKHMHIGFNQYVNEVRLNHVRELLSRTDYTMLQIAYECGFSTLRTFNRVFLNAFGMTPSKFKAQTKNHALKEDS